MQWMKSITSSENSLSNILETAVVKWPNFPDELDGDDVNEYWDPAANNGKGGFG